MRLSQALEDYLKVIYVLEADGEKATTTAIAQALDVSNASVTNMFKKLAGMKLIVHESYKGAVLSPAGKKVALEILRHHRLLELYLKEVMGYSWDEVHDEAEKLDTISPNSLRTVLLNYSTTLHTILMETLFQLKMGLCLKKQP